MRAVQPPKTMSASESPAIHRMRVIVTRSLVYAVLLSPSGIDFQIRLLDRILNCDPTQAHSLPQFLGVGVVGAELGDDFGGGLAGFVAAVGGEGDGADAGVSSAAV